MGKKTVGDLAGLLAEVASKHVAPGVAAAAVVDGEVVEVAAHGWRDQERAIPMTVDTPSRWYSISKPLTALALARQVAVGRIKWDQKVKDLVASLRFEDSVSTERATIRDCLLHRAGLQGGDWTWCGAPPDPDELLARLPHIPCTPGFRSGFHYQNFNFMLLGHVFRSLGTDWHVAMREMLGGIGVRPLTNLREFVAADRAIGYGPNGLGPAEPAGDFDLEGMAPAGAVCGSIKELALVAKAISRGGEGLVPPEAWAEVIRPVIAQGDREWSEVRQACAAMAGVSVIYRGERVLQWAGGFRGYVSHILAIPERKVAACALANRTASSAAEALAWSVLDLGAGFSPVGWGDRFLEQKRRFRKAAGERKAARVARPTAPWPAIEVRGRFTHPGYGDVVVEDGPVLMFRNARLNMTHLRDGTVSADGSTSDFSEIGWDLRYEADHGRVMAWRFNPDDRSVPCRFVRCDDR